ncbi:hypothetical protein AGR1A_pAt20187 [Agrobacterium fabacearum CFBP 5771]|nr:hypothetical protein AGR1A_pAt20187 [Agrobacterium fabacearum CFBP 5771]
MRPNRQSDRWNQNSASKGGLNAIPRSTDVLYKPNGNQPVNNAGDSSTPFKSQRQRYPLSQFNRPNFF